MDFDATPGGANATSYPTVEEADDYFSGRLHSEDWTEATLKEVALMTATRLLDRYAIWEGTKSTQEQALDWPRYGVEDKDGYIIDDDIVPDAIKQATCELAYALLSEDRTVDNPLRGFKSLKVDTLAIEVDRMDSPEALPDAVWQAIGVLGYRPSGAEVRLVRC